jgi:prepilin-type N-terminal cleavage/methylation domain-containing protein/prepilin-type processing-associated H-X9-DG protein
MPKKSQTGFTLVELLTVVAVTGVLAALLTTAISGTKARAHRVQCINNLHQLGLALQEFEADKNYYPPYLDLSVAVNTASTESRYWKDALEYEMKNSVKVEANHYNKDVWHCPSAYRPPDFFEKWGYDNYAYNMYGLGSQAFGVSAGVPSLGLSEHIVPNHSPTPRVKESEVIQPSEMYAIGDALFGGPTIIADGLNLGRGSDRMVKEKGEFLAGIPNAHEFDLATSTRRARARHQGKSNIVCCDGHVESPPLKFLFTDTSDEALRVWNRDHLPHRERLSP